MTFIQILARQPWVSRAGWALIHFLWQGAFLAALYALVRLRVTRPRARHVVACAALLAMCAAPLATFLCEGAAPAPARVQVLLASATSSSEWSTTPVTSAAQERFSLPDYFMPYLVAAWLGGALAFYLRLAVGCAFASRLGSVSIVPAPPEWQLTLDRLRARLQISRPVRLLNSARVAVPTVIGCLRPVVLMPVGALAGLPALYIEALLAHELAHIRRRDYFVNILQGLAEAMLFYHPAVWWISGQIRQERERSCDDIAVALTGDALLYATALAGFERSRPLRLGPSLAAAGGSLRGRIARLLGIEAPNPRIAWPAAPAAAVVLLFSLTAAVIAQQTAAKPSFEVASIQLSPPDWSGFQSYVRGDRYTALTATLRNLISFAYGIRDFQISGGSAWASSVRYNISAKMSPSAATSQARLMMQTLLADRFGLALHRVIRNRPGYALAVDRAGPKLTESAKPGPGLGLGTGHLNGRGADMLTLARELSSQIEAPITDRTGLKALYDFTLSWSPNLESPDAAGPSLSTALKEQLGLRLEPVKNVPVEFFVIDRAHKPTEN